MGGSRPHGEERKNAARFGTKTKKWGIEERANVESGKILCSQGWVKLSGDI
jgi:hypothetical protein